MKTETMTTVILSGGNGTRLKPLTEHMQKTMVEINQKPLLWYHIQQLKSHGINDVWVALHKFPETVINYFEDGSKYNININYSIEKSPLGTAGSLKNPNSEIEKHLRRGRFLEVYGDNLTNFNYRALQKFHMSKKSFLTVGLYQSTEPWTGGVIETQHGRIKSVVEKPPKEQIMTNTISAGVMICEPELLSYIPEDTSSDFGFDILPKLLNVGKPLFALDTGSYVQDCGTIERLKKARRDYARKNVRFDF